MNLQRCIENSRGLTVLGETVTHVQEVKTERILAPDVCVAKHSALERHDTPRG